MHGGASGSGAPIGNKNALRHGHYTTEAIAERRALAAVIRLSRATLADLGRHPQEVSERQWGRRVGVQKSRRNNPVHSRIIPKKSPN